MKETISEWLGFHNNCLLPLRSEFEPENLKRGLPSIYKYWQEQVKDNNYKGDFEKFIEDYGLEFEIWFIKQKFNLDGVERILIEISW